MFFIQYEIRRTSEQVDCDWLLISLKDPEYLEVIKNYPIVEDKVIGDFNFAKEHFLNTKRIEEEKRSIFGFKDEYGHWIPIEVGE